MSRRASWISSYFYEKSWMSSYCCIYPFFFGLTCILFALYKFLPSPFYLLVNSFLLAIGTIFCVQVLMRNSKPSASKNEKNECIAHKTAPYKLNLGRNDLRAKKLESFRHNPHVKSRRTFKGMKVRAVTAEENSSSSTDCKAVEENGGSQMAVPAVPSVSWPTEDLVGRSRVEDQEQPTEVIAENVALLDEDADKAKLGNGTDSCCLGSPWCLVDHQETALDTKSDPVNFEEKPDGFACSDDPVVDVGSAEEAQNKDDNEGEKAHKEKDDGAQKGRDEGDKVPSTSATWTADVPRNPMNLGDSEQERTRRLESLIAKRKARKALERNQTDLNGMQGSDSHGVLPFVNAPRRGSYDFLYDFDDPIPGSAPSLLNPRKNLFDLPSYDLVDRDDIGKLEKKDPPPAPVHREFFFTRHESFTIGAFMQERRPSRFNFFLGDQKSGLLDSVGADVHRLLQEARASRISFSSESDSPSEISQGEQEELPQEDESPFKLNVGNTEQIDSKINMDTDHGTQVVKRFEAVQGDISEDSVASSLVTFPEKAEVIDDESENNSSAPSEEEKNISTTSTHEQVISSFCGDSRDLIAVASDAMNVNNQVYHNLLHEEPLHEEENNTFKTSTHKQEIDGSCRESMKSMSVESDVVTMDEADQIHQTLVLKELDQVCTSSEVENDNYKVSTREQEIGDPCQDSMNSVAVGSDAVNMDKADQVHQNLVHEEHVHACTSPEAKNNTSSTSTYVQGISGGSREDSMNSVAVDSDNVSVDEQNHVCTSLEAQNSTSKTSTHEQVIGSSSKDSMDVDFETLTVDKTDQVRHNLAHEEPVHVSTSPEAENKDSKTSTHEQEIGGSSKESMNSVAVHSDIDKADRAHQNLNHEEPVHVSTSPDAENNSLKTSTHDQVMGETCGVPMDSAAMDYAANVEEAAQVDDNDASTPTLDQTSSIADKGDSNGKAILVSGINDSLSGEGSPLKAAAAGEISSGGRTDENESVVAKETSESKDLDAPGNDASRVQEDLGG